MSHTWWASPRTLIITRSLFNEEFIHYSVFTGRFQKIKNPFKALWIGQVFCLKHFALPLGTRTQRTQITRSPPQRGYVWTNSPLIRVFKSRLQKFKNLFKGLWIGNIFCSEHFLRPPSTRAQQKQITRSPHNCEKRKKCHSPTKPCLAPDDLKKHNLMLVCEKLRFLDVPEFCIFGSETIICPKWTFTRTFQPYCLLL